MNLWLIIIESPSEGEAGGMHSSSHVCIQIVNNRSKQIAGGAAAAYYIINYE
jgi:hypothetical protein